MPSTPRHRPTTRRALRPGVDTLEGRALLSGLTTLKHAAATVPTTVTRVAFHPDAALKGAGHATHSTLVAGKTASPGAIRPLATPGSTPYTPSQIRTAYGFSQLSQDGTGQTIAIVDAYSDPTIATDLHTFDTTFGLPDPTLNIVQQTGIFGRPPVYNSGWATEIALDVEWAHAIAPKATIMLIEANTSSYANLMSAVDYATTHGASQVSMSWGGGETTGYDSHFNHPGITYLNASGDSGYGASTPATSPYVTAVGGTTLTIDTSSNRITETGWSGSGGGISTSEARPAYQNGFNSNAKRAEPDVAYDANPSTGYYVYDNSSRGGGWYQVGGTSAAAPQWAGLTALVNQGRAASSKTSLGTGKTFGTNTALYALAGSGSYTNAAGDYYDVTSGSNGGATASTGYDLVTGLGSPVANKIVPALINS